MKPRRSALYVPADNARALEKARGLNVDCLIIDLEDAIAPDRKAEARAAACAAVAGLKPREIVIRINALSSAWGADDMAAAIAAGADAILLPKVQDAGEIAVAKAAAGAVPLWAMIEKTQAVLNAGAIAGSVEVLVLGCNDLLKEMGARHMPDRANLQTAMSLCVLAARAAGIAVLDGVHNRLDDAEGFMLAALMARDFGFDGKTLIHPSQVAPCNAAFSPSVEEIAAALRVIEAFDQAPQTGVIVLNGRMIERLDAEIARRILSRAR